MAGRPPRRGRGSWFGVVVWPALAASWSAGSCKSGPLDPAWSIGAYRDRMLLAAEAAPRAAGPVGRRAARRAPRAYPVSAQSRQPAREALLTQPATATRPAPREVLAEIPDPAEAERVFRERLERLIAQQQEAHVISSYRTAARKAREYLQLLRQPQQVRLSLAECIQRALEHNYLIRSEAYNPAIARVRVVEAEAAFDAAFFLDTSWASRDEDVATQLAPGQSDTRRIEGGIRKLLPTGMQASTSLRQERQFLPGFQFQTLNPAYDTRFIAALTQPLLRGFGLDYNRAPIMVARRDQRIAQARFVQQVRDTLLEVETAYWRLVQARRQVMILAETVGQNYATYQTMQDRLPFDATPVELNNSLSRWKSREVQFKEAVKAVRDAEDQLKNLLNDPALKLSRRVEIVPTEVPLVAPLGLDHFAQVRTAVERRSEIRQARLEIEKARIATMRAKNETLPQLDLSFQYQVQGIGPNADTSLDRMTTNRFRSYTLSASFSYPFGNRRARAAWLRSRFQEHQAIVALRRVTDTVVQEVNEAVRALMLDYENIPTQLDAALASERNLRALQARSQRIDPSYLETELSAIEQLANARGELLRVTAEYNIDLVQLEKSKGTLLEYNNVAVADELARR